MTYRELYEKALNDLEHNKITLGEFEERIKPLNQEVRKTGYWIELGCVGNDNYDFECSECRHTDTQSKTVKVNYCWYCGAKMEGESNNE